MAVKDNPPIQPRRYRSLCVHVISYQCAAMRIVKRRYLFFIVFFVISLFVAQAHPASAEQGDPFIWSVKGGKGTVYLLGSLHLLKNEAYPLADSIELTYRAAQRLVFEADIDIVNSPAFQSRILLLGLLPEGETIDKKISKETYLWVQKRANELGIEMKHLARMRPWFCALTLLSLKLKGMGVDPAYGLDRYFFKRAQKDTKEIRFLETIDRQCSLFAELGEELDEAFLRQTLKDMEVIETMLPDILSAWKQGDTTRLASILTMSFKDYPALYEHLIAQRNREWLPTIEGFLQTGGSTLVVVGAGHLVGPQNLVALLQQKGYLVDRVPGKTREALHMTLMVAQIPTILQSQLDKERLADGQLQGLDADLYQRIKETLGEAFAAEHLEATLRTQMERELGSNQLDEVQRRLASSLSPWCADPLDVAMELATPIGTKGQLTDIFKPAPPQGRVEVIEQIALATKAKEVALQLAQYARLSCAAVKALTLPPQQAPSFSKLLLEAENEAPLLEPMIEQRVMATLLRKYGDLADDQLGECLAFARSNAARNYYHALQNGLRLALLEGTIRFGILLADLKWEWAQKGLRP